MTVKQPLDSTGSPQASESGALVEHTLSNGQKISLPPHDEFYASFTVRNRGLIPDDEQQRLRNARILVAGCGSVGGAVIEPLVRMGAEHLDLAEPDGFDLHNMNRQSVRLQDIDRNKAEVFRERMLDINPYASIAVHPHGITDENVEELVRASSIIIDAVDVTTQKPLLAKFSVHEHAKRFSVPVIAGYDVAGLQMLLIYDYRKPSIRLMHGKVRADQIATMQPMEFLRKVVPIAAIPYEMITELGRQVRGERQGFPQIVYTSHLFGVLALRATLD
ncbi:MAG: ThiF family adenylyltransferase, partial [Chloroflexi bacterium]|nr:ThiF family adenylyltransferase [Chloroflexota bacterium]